MKFSITLPLLLALAPSASNAFFFQRTPPQAQQKAADTADEPELVAAMTGDKKSATQLSAATMSATKPATEKRKFEGIYEDMDTKPFPNVEKAFPGAMMNSELKEFIADNLKANNYNLKTTLVATSLCCDEVNRPLEADLSDMFNTNFNMGGLAGFPFGGATSFGAMASHIPDGGSCMVVYGPHVGVDSEGNVGTVERRGRKSGGACCGSAVAASNYVAGVLGGDEKAALPTSALDAQQYFVGSMLLPHAERLESASEKMVELPFALYDAQSELMGRILEQSGGAVAGNGKTAVLGGIQINTPPGYSDYYLPLSFDIYSGGEVEKELLKKGAAAAKKFPMATKVYPGALTNDELTAKMRQTLKSAGYDESTTLVATSLCCDEVNRPLETELADMFDTNFNMGGLAGFPFGGATSFGAMASHIPDGGNCVVVYGPHVGVDESGKAGTVPRRGKESGGACCGSAVAASGYVASVKSGDAKEAELPDDPLDAQQYFVGSMLMPYADRLEEAEDTMVELPLSLYDAQTVLMKQIVAQSAGAVAGDGKIAVLGGVQINTPPGFTDYFLPKSFNLYNNKGTLMEKLWD